MKFKLLVALYFFYIKLWTFYKCLHGNTLKYAQAFLGSLAPNPQKKLQPSSRKFKKKIENPISKHITKKEKQHKKEN